MTKYKGYLITFVYTPKKHRILCIESIRPFNSDNNHEYISARYNLGKGVLNDIVYISMAKGLIDHLFLGDEVADVIKDIDAEWVKTELKSELQDDIIDSLFNYNLKFNKPGDILPEDKEYVLILLDRDGYSNWLDRDDIMDKRFYQVAQYDKELNIFDEFGNDSYYIDEVYLWSYLPNYLKEESK